MSWLKEVIGTEKAIIAMLHMQPMPGDPYFDKAKGMKWVIEKAREDLDALQEGGVDAIMFSFRTNGFFMHAHCPPFRIFELLDCTRLVRNKIRNAATSITNAMEVALV